MAFFPIFLAFNVMLLNQDDKIAACATNAPLLYAASIVYVVLGYVRATCSFKS